MDFPFTRISAIFLTFAILSLSACSENNQSDNPDDPSSVKLSTDFSAGPLVVMGLGGGTVDDVQSIGVNVYDGATLLQSSELAEISAGSWTGTIDGLPTGIPLSFTATAYSGLALAGTAIFEGTIARTLTVAGPNDIVFQMASIGDGLDPPLPRIVSAIIPTWFGAGTLDNPISFDIDHPSAVDYTIEVSSGSIDGSGDGTATGTATISGTAHDPTPSPDLDIYFSAPGVANPESILIQIRDPAYPALTSGAVYPLNVILEDASASGSVVFGPVITGVDFLRSTNELSVQATVSAGNAAIVSTLWSGTGSFAALSGSATTVSIIPFDDNMAGDVTLTVTDGNGLQAIFTRTIAPGDFPLLVISAASLTVWGDNESGLLGQGVNGFSPTPGQIGTDTDWTAVSTGFNFTVALKSGGTLWSWGKNIHGQLGLGAVEWSTSPAQVGIDNDWAVISTGKYHTLALKSDGTLWGSGLNGRGQLGTGDTTDYDVLVQIGSESDWVSVSGGGEHTVALKSDGTLWAWGRNNRGQLGMGDNVARSVPSQVGNDTDWASISTGSSFTSAMKTDGTLWAWGRNVYGELGTGDNTNRNTPTQIGVDTDWILLETGFYHTLALKTDGTLWVTGYNYWGQLGLGDKTSRNILTQIGLDTDWTAVSGSSWQTIARKTDGTQWAWGGNIYGQLGLGDTVERLVPTKVGTDTDWNLLATGLNHTLASKTDGTLWAWGNRSDGGLGLGDAGVDTFIPATLGPELDWAAIGPSLYHALILKSDATLWVWGWNFYGQLGLGDTTDRTTPQQLGADTDWTGAAGGGVSHDCPKIRRHALVLGRQFKWQFGGGGYRRVQLSATSGNRERLDRLCRRMALTSLEIRWHSLVLGQ